MMTRCRTAAVVAAALSLALLGGCGDEDVYTVSQVDEIVRYINDSEIGRELFRTGSMELITDDPYVLSWSDTVYADRVDSSKRTVDVSISDPVDFGFGVFYTAEVTVIDRLYGTTTRSFNSQVVSTGAFVREFERFALMVKLGDNGQAFSGWLLEGYNGGTPRDFVLNSETSTGELIIGSDDVTFVMGQYSRNGFRGLDNMIVIPDGDILSSRAGTLVFSPVVTWESPTGYVTLGMERDIADTTRFVADLATPANNPRIYSTITVQSFTRVNGRVRFDGAWSIPFRITP